MDTSLSGWGPYLQELVTMGTWTEEKAILHISAVEMRVILLAFIAIYECLMEHHHVDEWQCDNGGVSQ